MAENTEPRAKNWIFQLHEVLEHKLFTKMATRASDEHLPISGAGAVTSVRRAAALLAPEKLVFGLPWDPDPTSTEVDLPCFHRATSIVLERTPFVLGTRAEFPALQTLTLTGCQLDGLGALLSLCPHLRVLRLGPHLARR
uniref:Uncharacterized protein n=1 Tax=Aegilops tauschii TaxID=37682 RepID=R7W6I2_AEGTA